MNKSHGDNCPVMPSMAQGELKSSVLPNPKPPIASRFRLASLLSRVKLHDFKKKKGLTFVNLTLSQHEAEDSRT